MRVVCDTNLLVSLALVEGGRLAPIWDAWREGRFDVLVCDELLAEVEEVLQRPKLARYLNDGARAALLRDLCTLTLHVTLGEPFPPFEDDKDRFLLALVRDGRADALLTGDHVLQALERFDDAVVAAPTGFIQALEQA